MNECIVELGMDIYCLPNTRIQNGDLENALAINSYGIIFLLLRR